MKIVKYKENFINKSIIKHSNKYNYDSIDYVNNYTKVKICCLKHGYFYQTPNSHLNGSGCPECANVKKLTKEKFIEKSKIIHNDGYDYSLVNYINNKTKVIIICQKHGIFTQAPHSHLKGQRCPKCFGTNSKTLSKDEFIEKSKKVHGDKYIYEKTIYINNHSKLSITCKKHGDFTQKPYNHLQGDGCPDCAITKKLSKEEFIEKSNQIHKFLYGYENVNYINNNTKVFINCKKHGLFTQRPLNHLSGEGCPICNSSKGEILINNILITNKINFKSQFSFKDLKDKSLLKFDFAILDKNNKLKSLIEFNGEQHYKQKILFHKSKDEFLKSVNRDNMKISYCIDKNIKLYIIRFDDDINHKMNIILKNN